MMFFRFLLFLSVVSHFIRFQLAFFLVHITSISSLRHAQILSYSCLELFLVRIYVRFYWDIKRKVEIVWDWRAMDNKTAKFYRLSDNLIKEIRKIVVVQSLFYYFLPSFDNVWRTYNDVTEENKQVNSPGPVKAGRFSFIQYRPTEIQEHSVSHL